MSTSSPCPTNGRLAIVGCGSSGLITLKNAIERLPGWHVDCFEASDSIVGCWGNPYRGFVSTSTKYTTQFACFQLYDARVDPDESTNYREFFCEDEFGKYLTQFADHYKLHGRIRLNTRIERINRCESGQGWLLTHAGGIERFDQLVVCTGLAAGPQDIACQRPLLKTMVPRTGDPVAEIRDLRVVVIGGGESAVDFADRLACAERQNQVYLSLKSGIRVSPRYHPVRGVPSDFLRNRLMLSIHPDVRNWIGEGFVRSRIRYQEMFESLFPKRGVPESRCSDEQESSACRQRRKKWALRLTKTSKDSLFNMFHNKSDRFLDAVGEQRIKIIGPPTDGTCDDFYDYSRSESLNIEPDLVIPAVGYESILPRLFDEPMSVQDFYLGCCHIKYADLHLVGFARPIIGNIPSISEIQAEYVCGLVAGDYAREPEITAKHQRDKVQRAKRYPRLNQKNVYPVEMFPYCDALATRMDRMPAIHRSGGIFAWMRSQLTPATTIDYQRRNNDLSKPHIYMPWLLIVLLWMLWPFSCVYSWFDKVRNHSTN